MTGEGNLLNRQTGNEEKLLSESKERIIGLDILKILSCLGITMLHFLGYTNVLSSFTTLHYNKIFAYIFNIFVRTSVNLFIMISGYFLVKSRFRYRRLLLIWGETFIYSILFFLIGAVFKLETISISLLVKACLPILSRHYWFATAYLVLYCLTPFINKLVCALDKKEYTILVCGSAILYSAWTTFFWFSEGALIGGHTGILWVIYMYTLGGYFRMYPPKIRKRTLLIGVIFMVGVLVAYQYAKERISLLSNFAFLQENSFFVLLLSTSMFLLFKDVKSSKLYVRRIITILSSGSFGVYLIQENCMIREWLWKNVVRSNVMVDKWYLFPVFLLVAVVLFAIGLLISNVYKIVFQIIEDKVKNRKGKN